MAIPSQRVPFGTGSDLTSSANFTFDGSTAHAPIVASDCDPANSTCGVTWPNNVGDCSTTAGKVKLCPRSNRFQVFVGDLGRTMPIPRFFVSGSCTGESGLVGDFCRDGAGVFVCNAASCVDNTTWLKITAATIATTTSTTPSTSSTSTSSTSTSSTSTSTTSTSSTTLSGTGTDYAAQDATVGCWYFEDALADGAADSCGGNTQLFQNITPTTADTTNFKEGSQSSLFVRASNMGLTCTNAVCPSLNLGGASQTMTVGGWARPVSLGIKQNVALDDGSQNGYQLYLTTGNKLEAKVAAFQADCTTAPYTTITGSTTFAVNTFHHVVLTDDNSVLTLYVDGIAETPTCSSSVSGSGCVHTSGLCAASDAFGLGNSSFGAYWNGNLDEMFLRNDALTAVQVCEVCRKGLAGTTSDRGATCGSCTLP